MPDRIVPVPPIDDGVHLRDGGGDTTYCGEVADMHSLGCRKEWERHAKTRCLRCEIKLVKRDRQEVAGLLGRTLAVAELGDESEGDWDWVPHAHAAVRRWA